MGNNEKGSNYDSDRQSQLDHLDNDIRRKREQNSDLESQWNTIEKYYRRRHPNVTDEDVNYRSGEFESMTDRIAKRTNRSRDQVTDEIRNWKSEK